MVGISLSPHPKAVEGDVQAQRQAEREFFLIQPSIQAFNELHEAHPHWGGRSALLSLPIQILISFRNHSHMYPEIIFNQISGNPMTKPTSEINRHRCEYLYVSLLYRTEHPSFTINSQGLGVIISSL